MEETNKCKNCKYCKYFREFSAKLLGEALAYDGYCRKRQKYKKFDDRHSCFVSRDK